MEDRLVLGHVLRPSSFSDGRDDVGAQAGFHREGMVSVEFEAVRQVPGRDQDGHLGELRAERAVLLIVKTELQRRDHEIGNAQQDRPGWAGEIGVAKRLVIGDRLLLGVCHLLGWDRGQIHGVCVHSKGQNERQRGSNFLPFDAPSGVMTSVSKLQIARA